MKRIVLLRLGHRPERDKRITTHVGLTARLLGAEGMLLASDDPGIVKTLEDVVRRWGGDFYVKNNVNFKQEIKEWKDAGGKVCHLSMYGVNLPGVTDELKSCDKLMIVVGAEKVPQKFTSSRTGTSRLETSPIPKLQQLLLPWTGLQMVSRLRGIPQC